MSRIGKKAVAVPTGVTANVEGQTIKVKGPKGALQLVGLAAQLRGGLLVRRVRLGRLEKDAPTVVRHLHVIEVGPTLGADVDRGARGRGPGRPLAAM